ncbi:ureidoacrylate peracid hydrolase [Rhizobiales bacterium GAS191]|jgi:ureidoacrylate peracid hydrolase|nr:ureidoacrylate peracid hydrolase [Rhizobiales bacterium GAS113]SEE87342.1 ureidoacrylate peracid hydrolase [Rhizobiales bacterium GAS191]
MTDETPLPPELVAMATRRRAGIAVFDHIVPRRTALVALNMQNAWLAEGAPFDAAGAARTVLPQVNGLAALLRDAGATIIWLQQTVMARGEPGYWATYFENFIGSEQRDEAVAALLPGGRFHALSPDADVRDGDIVLPKHRFSAFSRNPHDLDRMLRERDIDTLIVAGTATNICCESTVREAMMLDYRTFMPHDAVAAPQRDAHLAGLRSVMQVFADIRPVATIARLLRAS